MHFYCGLKTEGLGELKLEMHELLSSEGKGHHLLSENLLLCMQTYFRPVNAQSFGKPPSWIDKVVRNILVKIKAVKDSLHLEFSNFSWVAYCCKNWWWCWEQTDFSRTILRDCHYLTNSRFLCKLRCMYSTFSLVWFHVKRGERSTRDLVLSELSPAGVDQGLASTRGWRNAVLLKL